MTVLAIKKKKAGRELLVDYQMKKAESKLSSIAFTVHS